uniref:Uncharacterized protein n=1 Tax=Panagrolaimus davidi TaxID=227884 RepID=A0A914PQD3_9BILA
MSVNEIVLSDYFYPFNQLSEQDFTNHRFIRLPQHCCVTSAFVINGNFEPIFNALKVDKLILLKKLIETKHITETWLKFCSNINYKSFMFFNINIKYGYKVVASTKAVYGHNAILIIPSDIDKTGEISKYIETHFKQESLLSKVFDCFGSPFYLLFPKPQNPTGLRYDTTVHLLFNFTKEFTLSLSQISKDIKKLVQKPLNIIGLEPHEIATENFDQHEIAGDLINLILMGLKIRYLIEKDFPACTGILEVDNVKVNEVISEISTQQLKVRFQNFDKFLISEF